MTSSGKTYQLSDDSCKKMLTDVYLQKYNVAILHFRGTPEDIPTTVNVTGVAS